MKFKNIEMLIDGSGEITIGKVGQTPCAATASDDHQCLAMLARRADETLEALLRRLDSAIADAIEEQIFVDEING